MNQIQVVPKDGGAVVDTRVEALSLDKASVIHLKIAPESVLGFERRGSDLVLSLRDGSSTVLQGFFNEYAQGGRNDLVLEDAAGVLWWGQYTGPWSEFHFTEIEWLDGVPVAAGSDGLPGWLIAGLGLLGIGAAAAAGGGGGGGGFSFPPVAPPPLNRPPTGEADPIAVRAGHSGNGQVVARDADGDTLTYVLGEPPAHGTVVIDPETGAYTYTPEAGYDGPDSFTVVITDGRGGTTTSTVDVTVQPNNEPTLPNYALTTPEDTPVEGQVTGVDLDGDNLSYVVGTPPANGIVTVNPDGTYTYTPGANFNGTDTFTVVVDDGNGGTATSTVEVTVSPVNDAPTVPNYTLTTPEDTPVAGQVTGVDLDGDSLSYVAGTPPANGTVVVNPDGTYTYTPGANFNGTDSFTVIADDGNGGTATSTVEVTVSPVNDAPTVPNYTLTTPEDAPVAGQVTGVDLDGDSLSYVAGTPPANGTVVVNPDGTYTYTPGANFNGTDTFTVVVSDGNGGTATSTVEVTVSPVNDAPTVPNYTLTTPEDTPVAGQVTGVDLDGDSLGYVVGTLPANGTVVVNADGTYTYTPDANFNGSDSFTVVVSDGNGGTATSTVSVTINPVNDAPTVPNYTLTTPEDTPVAGQVTGIDLDGNSLGYVVGTPPASGTVVVNADGTYTYTPGANFNGTDSFTVVVSDGNGGTATSTVEVTVSPVNDAPTVPNYTLTTPEDTPVAGRVTGVDLDGDSLGYVVGTSPVNGTVVVNADGSYTYTPGANFNGTDSFTVIVDDGNGGTATSTVSVTIDPVNDAPTVPNYTLTTPEDAPVAGQVTGVDLDGDSLSYVAGTPPANGTVVVNPDGTYTYTPGANFNGTDTFTVVVSDGKGGTATSTVSVTIDPVNDAPTVPNYTLTTPEDTPVGGQVTGVDLDGDSLSYVAGTPPANGTVVVNPDGSYTYTPGANFNGSDSFTVVVSDGNGGTATSTVSVTINPVNDAPTVPNYTLATPEDTPVAGQVTGVDLDGDSLGYVVGTLPANGTVVVNADGTYTYTPDANFNGSDSFTVVVSDGNGGTATSTVSVTINPVNDAPTVPNYTLTTPEDTPVGGQVTGVDLDGDSLSYVAGTPPAHGTVVVNPNGTYTYTPGANFNGTDTFTVVVSDGNGGTVTSTVDVTVTPTQDAPTVPDYTLTTSEDTPVAGQVTGVDLDGDTLSYVVGTPPANGAVIVRADGTYTYTPGANFDGTDSFTVVVSDGHGGTATSTVDVTINPVNDRPVFIGDDNNATSSYAFSYDENSTETDVLGVVRTTDVDSPPATYAITAGNENGWYAIDANGRITLTAAGVSAQANNYEAGPNAHALTVRASDDAGGTRDITVTLSERDLNEAPILSATSAGTVYEDALPGGIYAGSDHGAVTQGTLSIADGDAGTAPADLVVSLGGPPGITAQGQPVTWGWDAGTSTLTGSAVIGGVVTSIMTVQVGAVSQTTPGNFAATYTATLTGPMDHPATGEDALSLAFTATVGDGVNNSAPASFDVTVQDDAPVLGDGEISVNVEPLQTNLMVVLDLSGSMAMESPTRLQRAKEAIQNLIEGYDDYGDVKVKLVTFSTSGQAYATWMDAGTAISTINALSSSGTTNYWSALQAAMGANGFDSAGKLVGPDVQNVSYFFTDGEPNAGAEITPSRETTWSAFLAARDIDSYAIGIGNSLNAGHAAQVDPIAFDGSTGADGTDKNGLIIRDTSELDDVLQGTISPPAVGNLLTGGLGEGQGFGGDGGYVSTMTVDGDRYDYDTATGILTVTADGTAPDYVFDSSTKTVTVTTEAGGTLFVELETGEFNYQALPADYTETITYQVTDRDGDVSNMATQKLNITFGSPPVSVFSFAAADSLGLHAVDALEAPDNAGQRDNADWKTDLLSSGDSSGSSFEGLLNAAFPPLHPTTEATAATGAAAGSEDSTAFVPPVATALDDELHHAAALYA